MSPMKTQLPSIIILVSAIFGCITLSSWTGGSTKDAKSDSLAIVRVVKPVNEKFNINAAVFVSKGLGKISTVQVNNLPVLNSETAVNKALSRFLSNGYTLENSTELMQNGVLTNTFYFKKKLI
jgi:hypothetical protein